MKAIVLHALFCLTFAAPIASAQQGEAGGKPLSLSEAVRLAQRNSPTAVAARNSSRSGAAAVRTSLAQFLPTVGFSMGASRSGGETFFQGKLVPYAGDPWSYGKGYNVNLALFDGGQRWLGYRAAHSGLEAAEANEISAMFGVAQNVKVQYFAVLAARESEAAGNRQLEQADQQLKLTLARMRAGLVARMDSIRSAIQVVNARLAILNARNNLRNANASLTRLVASQVPVTAMAADTADAAHIDLDSASLVALADAGPTVRSAEATAAAAKAVRRSSMTPYLPTLGVGYSFRSSNTSKEFSCCGGAASSSNSLSFGINYTVFDGLRRETNLTNASIAENNAGASLRDAKLAVRENLAQFLSAYQTAQESIQLQLLNIAAAEEDLHAQQQLYSLGSSKLLDVLTSQTALENARAALVGARFQARTAKAQIETLIGRDLK